MSNLTAPKTAATIHDLSGFGRCSLTVVIPVLSAMGIQSVPMPTALLSTHTGGFEEFSFLDTTRQMKDFMDHWSKLELSFDAIYSGFLGSSQQCELVSEFIDRFREKKENTVVLIDPVMGDNGTPYSTITDDIRTRMKKLVQKADIITPNVTEACILLGLPLDSACHTLTKEQVQNILLRLAETNATVKNIVLTGIRIHDAIVTACLDGAGSIGFYSNPRIPQSYPGTGDLFASVLLGKILQGSSLLEAAEFSSGFTYQAILQTAALGTPPRNGVILEKLLYKLITQ